MKTVNQETQLRSNSALPVKGMPETGTVAEIIAAGRKAFRKYKGTAVKTYGAGRQIEVSKWIDGYGGRRASLVATYDIVSDSEG